MTRADDLLTDLADALRRRVAERRQAEEHLAAFVFREGSDGQRPPLDADVRHFVGRTLAAAGEPGTLDLLDRLSSGSETVQTLADGGAVGLAGGLAIADRIAELGVAGLAGRDLETGRVRLTALGSAVLALARDWERRTVAPAPETDRRRR
jgi:hypothetical protein